MPGLVWYYKLEEISLKIEAENGKLLVVVNGKNSYQVSRPKLPNPLPYT